MSNNPYLPPPTRRHIPSEHGRLPAEMKRAWNRFTDLDGRMRRWHFEGKTWKVKARMSDWEARNETAYKAGFEVPDHFDPEGRGLKIRIRGGIK